MKCLDGYLRSVLILIRNFSGQGYGFCVGQVAYPRAAHTTTSNVPDTPASLSLCMANFFTGCGSMSAPLCQSIQSYSASHAPSLSISEWLTALSARESVTG